MPNYMAKNWWEFLRRSILGILFGILTFTMPGITLAAVVIIWGAHFLADGIISRWSAATLHTHIAHRWMVRVQRVIRLVAEIIAPIMPRATAIDLMFAVAASSSSSMATRLPPLLSCAKKSSDGSGSDCRVWLRSFSRCLSLRPLAVIQIIGTYVLILGVLVIGFAFRIKGNVNFPETMKSSI